MLEGQAQAESGAFACPHCEHPAFGYIHGIAIYDGWEMVRQNPGQTKNTLFLHAADAAASRCNFVKMSMGI